ncbi:hypothetical protein AVEN_272701-1 [Araneus ventricosus]|uniref:Uncharacterized protein n=1 Tax=Araneus ventricosus TaxID=182803 RepID=A0A4Y2LDS5_ARAVE|nr:hypothetical protein AVEN_272701-1 [Araneus ventricosus]
MRSDYIVNVMYRENFPRFSQGACVERFFNSEKIMQGNKIRRQIAFAELRSATSSVGSRRKKLLDNHVKILKPNSQPIRRKWPQGFGTAYKPVSCRRYYEAKWDGR